jgi:hypothetical protein
MRFRRLLRGRKLYHTGIVALVILLFASTSWTQTATVAQMQALQQSMAANQQRLRTFQWIEVRQVTIDGNDGPKAAFRCEYAADGTVLRAPVNGPAPQQSFDFNTEMMSLFDQIGDRSDREYMQKASTLAESYIPLNPQRMLSLVQGGTATAAVDSGSGFANLTFRDYALPGDQMLVAYDPQAQRVVNVMVNTYIGENKPKNALTVMAEYEALPDGTNHLRKSVLQPNAKKIVITNRNENYQPLVQ